MSDRERAELQARLDVLTGLRDLVSSGRDVVVWEAAWEIAWQDALDCANIILAAHPSD